MQTLDVLKAYNPDSPFTLRSNSMNLALNGSMPLVTTLSVSTNEFASNKLRFNKHIASSMSIDPPESKENSAILQLNAFFIILFIVSINPLRSLFRLVLFFSQPQHQDQLLHHKSEHSPFGNGSCRRTKIGNGTDWDHKRGSNSKLFAAHLPLIQAKIAGETSCRS